MRLIRLKWGFDKDHYNCCIKFILVSYMCVFVLIYVTLCAFINILLHMIDFGTLIQLCGCFIMHIWFNMCSHVIMCFGILFAHIHKNVPYLLYVFHTYMLFGSHKNYFLKLICSCILRKLENTAFWIDTNKHCMDTCWLFFKISKWTDMYRYIHSCIDT